MTLGAGGIWATLGGRARVPVYTVHSKFSATSRTLRPLPPEAVRVELEMPAAVCRVDRKFIAISEYGQRVC